MGGAPPKKSGLRMRAFAMDAPTYVCMRPQYSGCYVVTPLIYMPVLLRGPMLRGVFSQNTPLIPPKSISLREIAGGAGSP